MNTNNIINLVEQPQLRTDIPTMAPGDTVIVKVVIQDEQRERVQNFKGVVIAIRHRGVNSSFIVRKISHGIGVERTFMTHSLQIASIAIERRGLVRKAKLHYLRALSGKAARIRERLN